MEDQSKGELKFQEIAKEISDVTKRLSELTEEQRVLVARLQELHAKIAQSASPAKEIDEVSSGSSILTTSTLVQNSVGSAAEIGVAQQESPEYFEILEWLQTEALRSISGCMDNFDKLSAINSKLASSENTVKSLKRSELNKDFEALMSIFREMQKTDTPFTRLKSLSAGYIIMRHTLRERINSEPKRASADIANELKQEIINDLQALKLTFELIEEKLKKLRTTILGLVSYFDEGTDSHNFEKPHKNELNELLSIFNLELIDSELLQKPIREIGNLIKVEKENPSAPGSRDSKICGLISRGVRSINGDVISPARVVAPPGFSSYY